jgi:hypothetical protein
MDRLDVRVVAPDGDTLDVRQGELKHRGQFVHAHGCRLLAPTATSGTDAPEILVKGVVRSTESTAGDPSHPVDSPLVGPL